ncbi:MAG: cytochrome c biogenesis heme-transporting ATPase CcmA [Pseudohongiellaceae bacterium]|nr:cytochrome c biogenesis heme-transporting ATPase CcmA [Pseudohongiellaceae bacterium]
MSLNAEAKASSSESRLLDAHELFCERDDRVLFSGLNFSLDAGDLMQVQGSNGSGKTTLLRILCGLNSSYEGEIRWQGEDIHDMREEFQAALHYIGHRAGVNKVLTARENLRWSVALHRQVSDTDIDDALARVGLLGYADVVCRNMSAGQQQRVSLAGLLLSPARLWVLDEPFTTLDVKGVKILENLLVQHVEGGGAVLVTTHHQLDVAWNLRRLNLDGLSR